jgi:hypothetical protein
MKRFITLFLLALFSSCASEQQVDFNTSPESGIAYRPDSSVKGSCNPNFCPVASAGRSCCTTANGPCGIDLGMGCMVKNNRDGG